MWLMFIPIGASIIFLYFFNAYYDKKSSNKVKSSSDEDVIFRKEYTETEMTERLGIEEIKNNMITELSGNIVAGIRYSTDEFFLLDDPEQDAYEDELITFALSLSFDMKVIEIPKEISGKSIVSEMKVLDAAVDEKNASLIDVYRKTLIESIEKDEKRVAVEKILVCFTRNERDKSTKLKLLRDRVSLIEKMLPFPIEILDTNALIELNTLMIRKKIIDVEEIEKSGGFELHA